MVTPGQGNLVLVFEVTRAVYLNIWAQNTFDLEDYIHRNSVCYITQLSINDQLVIFFFVHGKQIVKLQATEL